MSVLAALLLSALACIALDVRITWSSHPWRPQEFALVWQTAVAWSALALIVVWPVRWVVRRWGAPLTTAFVGLATPVALHQALREPLRGRGSPWLAVLGAGAAVLVVVWVGRRLERVVPPARLRGLAALAAIVAGVALVPGLGGGRDEPPVLGARHPAPEGRPHLLLLVWDTTRADRTSPYGADPELTPHLARLAEQGAVYESSWSSSLFTLSSHVSLLTGLPPGLHGTTLRHQTVSAPTVAGMLRRSGYRTGAFVGTSVLLGGRGLQRDFDVYDDGVDPPVCDTWLWALVHDGQAALAKFVPFLRGNGLPHWFQDFQRPAADALASARRFAFADDERPWFMLVNLFDVHWPYLPGADAMGRFVAPYDGPLDGYLFRSNSYPEDYEPDEADKAFVRSLYDAEMWELDQAVDAFLRDIDVARGDVCMVMTSDHGEGLGEGGLWSHDELVEPQTRVPLVVYAPGRAAAGRVGVHVSGLDVAPTLLALAGAPMPEPPLPGTALPDGPPPEDRVVFVQDHDNPDPQRDGDVVIRGRFKLLSRGGVRTLHAVLDDPLHQHDITAQHPDVAAELGQALDAIKAAGTDAGEGMDNLDALRALGYVGN